MPYTGRHEIILGSRRAGGVPPHLDPRRRSLARRQALRYPPLELRDRGTARAAGGGPRARPAAHRRLRRAQGPARPGRTLLPHGHQGWATDGGQRTLTARGHFQHGRRRRGQLEASYVGPGRSRPAAGLRLERTRGDGSRPASEGARLLRGGRGRAARLRAWALLGSGHARKRRGSRGRTDALLRGGCLVPYGASA